ncbi:MAG: amidohydrolase, partial [Chloroflexi bacterium]
MIILYNAKIHTLDPHQPECTAIAIDGDTIYAVGSDDDIQAAYHSQRDSKEDMHGKVILPGLTDAHIHLEHYAASLNKVNCETDSLDECLRRVAERVQNAAPGTWVLGHGWNQNNWPEGFGTAAMLDAIAPQNPVYLTAKSLHAGWANTPALRAGDVERTTEDPVFGQIGRDLDGNPDGILYESAMELIGQVIPELSVYETAEAIAEAQKKLLEMGLTSVHDFDQQRCFSALQILHQNKDLVLRVSKSIPLESMVEAAAVGLRTGFGDDTLRIGQVKGFADGALGPHTAAMFQPYEDEPENRGILMLDAEELFECGRAAVDGGLGLAIHAIGDRANHEMLDGFENLRRYEMENVRLAGKSNYRPLRHRIEHLQIIHPDDRHRLAELGVIASMQPIHAASDMLAADRYWGARANLSYAWRTQLEQGAVLAFGSDAP